MRRGKRIAVVSTLSPVVVGTAVALVTGIASASAGASPPTPSDRAEVQHQQLSAELAVDQAKAKALMAELAAAEHDLSTARTQPTGAANVDTPAGGVAASLEPSASQPEEPAPTARPSTASSATPSGTHESEPNDGQHESEPPSAGHDD
jgi:hypothetical protein